MFFFYFSLFPTPSLLFFLFLKGVNLNFFFISACGGYLAFGFLTFRFLENSGVHGEESIGGRGGKGATENRLQSAQLHHVWRSITKRFSFLSMVHECRVMDYMYLHV